MQVVEIRSKSQSFYGALNILFNVCGSIGDSAIVIEDSETTIGSNLEARHSARTRNL